MEVYHVMLLLAYADRSIFIMEIVALVVGGAVAWMALVNVIMWFDDTVEEVTDSDDAGTGAGCIVGGLLFAVFTILFLMAAAAVMGGG